MSTSPTPIVLDCDPGHDDAIAILLAAGDPRVELLGITTVAGNQTLDRTTHNACVLTTLAGLDIPVVAGSDRPLLRPLLTAGHIHGDTGLDGPAPITPRTRPTAGHAADFLARTVLGRPGQVTVVGVGPLTNLALAVRRYPELAGAAREVVVMGGAIRGGNVTPTAEFNIAVDPEAAAIVFDAPWAVTMMGLDLTHQAQCTPEVQERIRAVGTPAATLVDELMTFYGGTNRAAGRSGAPPVHDPCAVAYVADRTLVEVAPAAIVVETTGRFTSGTTVVDLRAPNDRHHVGVRLESERFWADVVAALVRLG